MLNLLNFFADGADTGAEGSTSNPIFTIIIIVVMLALFVVMMIVPQRKQKRAQAAMQAKLGVGVTIMTIGGIIGEIVQMDDQNVWLVTGLDDQTCILKFTNKAIHSVIDNPVASVGTVDENGNTDSAEEVIDEIK